MLKKVFFTSIFGTATLIALVILLLPTPSTQANGASSELNEYDLVIQNATVFINGKYQDDLDVAIKDGHIAELANNLDASAATTLDGRNKVLVPGLVDAHTHSFANALQEAINFGVTTHFDMFSPSSELSDNRLAREDINNMATDLFSAGMLATVEGGHGTQFGVGVDTVDNQSEVKAWVEQRKNEGSDYIKLVYMPNSVRLNSLDLETSKAIIDAAHDQDLLAVAHISSQSGANDMLKAGIDGLVHQFADSLAKKEFIDLAKASNIFIVPTLSVIASVTGQGDGTAVAAMPTVAPFLSSTGKAQLQSASAHGPIPGFDIDLALTNTRLMHEAGITILAGSDAANPGTAWGISLHQEMVWLNRAGLTPEEVLQSASELVFEAFGISSQGKIAVGHRANLLLLNRPVSTSIESTLDIKTIIKNGVITQRIKPESQAGTNAEKISTTNLSNFEHSLNGPRGFTWNKTDDSIVNGKSQSRISTSDNGLNIYANVKPGFAFPWSGASISSQSPININEMEEIEFEVSGTPGSYRLMIFSDVQTGIPPTQTFQVDNDVSTIRLKLSDFQNAPLDRITGFAWLAGPGIGEFSFTLDDVKLRK